MVAPSPYLPASRVGTSSAGSDPGERPVVSVYMLAYNHERYIGQAIEGVVSQATDFPFELIIGEDCSTDATRSIAMDYQRRYPAIIRVLAGDANVGMHRNADRCRKACRGEFIAICEGDDYWHHPGKLQLQVEKFRSNEDACLVHTDHDRLIGRRLLKNAGSAAERAGAHVDFPALLDKMTIATSTAMYRKSILDEFDNTGIPKHAWPFGDYPRALYAALRGRVLYLPVSTATYRHVHGSMTNRGRDGAMKMEMSALQCREVFMSIANLPQEAMRKIRASSHRRIMERALLAGRKVRYLRERAWLHANGHATGFAGDRLALLLLDHPALLKKYLRILDILWKIDLHLKSREAVPAGPAARPVPR